MIVNDTQHGYLLLADISGYTSYVATTELTHSQEILTELLFQARFPRMPNWLEKLFCKFILHFQLFKLWKLESINELMKNDPVVE